MRPPVWQPSVALSEAEATIARRVRRAKVFAFLREQRQVIFDAVFQEELAGMYGDAPQGHPPVAPARLALATILKIHPVASEATTNISMIEFL